ncbi:MAG TPA: tripartite tricarboxylate transporter TctB family protein [Rhodobacteraceae bacterium]|nr:tripartite tricarboxylate transporter TctB family protein [Paracoccaceae bacterium]
MSDRLFGLTVIAVALGYIFSATMIQTSFLSDPVGPKTFPYMIGGVAILCALAVMWKPDDDPQWPGLGTFARLLLAVLVLIGYAYTLKPGGFVIPTALAAGLLSYQISPRALPAMLTGAGLSVGLFAIFKFALGLGLYAFPKSWF